MSLAHLEVNFMQGDGYGSMFILHVAIQCDQHPLFKMLSFLQCVLLPSVSKSSGYESISLYFTSNGSAFLPVQCYRCWWIDFGSCVYRTSALTHWFVSAKQSVFTGLPVCMTPLPSHCSNPSQLLESFVKGGWWYLRLHLCESLKQSSCKILENPFWHVFTHLLFFF